MNVEINLDKLKKCFVLKYGIVICVVCFFAACQSRNHDSKVGKTNSLTIICDSSINRNLFYDFNLISNDDTIKTHSIKYDSIAKTTTLKWDSLKNNDYRFEVISVFQQKNKTSFTLRRDTAIRIFDNYKYEFRNVINKETLLKSDTIIIVFQSQGCSYNFESYKLTRDNEKYRLKGSKRNGRNPIDKIVLPEIIGDLNQIQVSCRNHKLHEYSSTRSLQFMLLADKKVFYFDDMYSSDSQLFSGFKEKYIRKQN